MADTGKRKREDEAAEKRQKIDETNIDFMISDLSKEEAQLVLTRLLRVVSEDDMRSQIELVKIGRAKMTLDQIEKHMEQLKQLQAMQAAANAGLPVFSMAQMGFAGAEGMEAGGTSGLSKVKLRGIKNRVRDAFKKQNAYVNGVQTKRYKIQLETLDEDIKKAKDEVLKGNLKTGLDIMEAVTEEISEKASNIPSEDLLNLTDTMEQIGHHWIDIFLSDAYDLPEEQREDWFEKLRSWDTSAEEESHLACARWAAKFGWQDDTLKEILAAKTEEDLRAISGFKEPSQLTQARLSILEREKRFEEAVNLATVTGLGQHAAKFLMRLNKIDEAVEFTLQIKDVEKIFNMAILARPISVEAALKLGVASVALFSDQSRVFSSGNSSVSSKINWVCDLAITEKKLPELLSKVVDTVFSKDTQFEFCRVLMNKERPVDAIELCFKILQPYAHDAMEAQRVILQELGVIPKDVRSHPEEIIPLPTTFELRKLVPGANPPANLLENAWKWIVESVEKAQSILQRQQQQQASGSANPGTTSAPNVSGSTTPTGGSSIPTPTKDDWIAYIQPLEKLKENLVPHAIKLVDSAEMLLSFMVVCLNTEHFSTVQTIGSAAIELIKKQQEIDNVFREEKVRYELKYKELAEKAKAEELAAPLYEPPKPQHTQYPFEQKKFVVCKVMLNSALIDKSKFVRESDFKEATEGKSAAAGAADDDVVMSDGDQPGASAVPVETEAERQERMQNIERCDKTLATLSEIFIASLPNPTNLLTLCDEMKSKEEFKLSVRICSKAFDMVKVLSEKFHKYQEVLSDFNAESQEVSSMLMQGIRPAPEKRERLKELELKKEVWGLDPCVDLLKDHQLSSMLCNSGSKMLNFGLQSRQCKNPKERLTLDELKKVVDQIYANLSSQLLDSCTPMLSILRESSACNDSDEIVQYVGRKSIESILKKSTEYEAYSALKVEIDVIESEQKELQSQFNKALGDEQAKRLEQLHEEMEKFDETYKAGRIGEDKMKDSDAFDTQLYASVSEMLKSSSQRRKHLQRHLSTFGSTLEEEKIKALNVQIQEAAKEIPKHFKELLVYVQSPLYLHKLAQLVGQQLLQDTVVFEPEQIQSHLSLAVSAIQSAVTKSAELWTKMQSEFDPVFDELSQLLGEKSELWNNFQHKQQLSAEKLNRIRELTLIQKRLEAKSCYFGFTTTQYASLVKKCLVLGTEMFERQQSAMFTRLDLMHTEIRKSIQEEQLMKLQANVQRQQPAEVMEAVARAARENREREIQAILIVLPLLNEDKKKFLAFALTATSSPRSFLAVAKSISPRSTHTYEYHDDESAIQSIRTLVERVFEMSKALEKQRADRAFTHEKLALLREQQQEAVTNRKPFPEASLQQLEEYSKQVRLWNKEAMFNGRTSADYEENCYDAADLLLKTLLSRKTFLENDIESCTQEEEQAESLASNMVMEQGMTDAKEKSYLDPAIKQYFVQRRSAAEKSLVLVKSYINQIVAKFIPENINNPEHLCSLSQTLSRFVDFDLCADLTAFVRHLFSTVLLVKKEAASRQTLIDEREELISERTELASVNKLLKADQLKRLADLEHNYYHWSREPSYKCSSVEDQDNWLFSGALCGINTILSLKTKLSNQLEAYKAKCAEEQKKTADPNAMDTSDSIGDVVYTGEQVQQIEDLEKKISALSAQAKEFLEQVLNDFVRDPDHIYELQSVCSRNDESELVYEACKFLQKQIAVNDKQRQYLCELERKMYLLRKAKWDIEQQRKTFDEDRAKELAVLEKEFESAEDLQYGFTPNYEDKLQGGDAPEDQSVAYNNNKLDALLLSALKLIYKCAFEDLSKYCSKTLLDEKSHVTVDPKEVEERVAALVQKVKEAIDFSFSCVENPLHFNDLLKIVIQQHHATFQSFQSMLSIISGKLPLKGMMSGEESVLPIVKRMLEMYASLREIQQKREDTVVREIKELKEEKRELESKRLTLDAEKTKRLNSLLFDEQVIVVQPPYTRQTLQKLNSYIYDAIKQLRSTLLFNKKARDEQISQLERNPQLVRGKSSMTAADIKKEQKQSSVLTEKEYDTFVALCEQYMKDIFHLEELTNQMHLTKEEVLPHFKVGKYMQKLLSEQLVVQIKYEAYNKRLQELQLNTTAAQQGQSEIDSLQETIKELSRQLINGLSIGVIQKKVEKSANQMIDGAVMLQGQSTTKKSVADLCKQVIKEQSILVFRMTMKREKFEEVKNLVGDKEWESIKKDLIDFVKKYDTSLPGSVIDIKDKMELLLQEGLHKEALLIVPDPPVRDVGAVNFEHACEKYREMLEMLWFEVEKLSVKDLNQVFVFVEPFAKNMYQQNKFEQLEKLFDSIQAYFPDKIAPLYAIGNEILVANQSAKTYGSYVDFLTIVKKRLTELRRGDEWTSFITKVRNEAKRKKKLVQLMNVADL